jgi:hypothetical protein
VSIPRSLELALRNEHWAAGTAGAYVRLAGGTVDQHASLVSDLLVLAPPLNTLSVRTRLPIQIPVQQADTVARFCVAVNAGLRHGVLFVAADGAPEATTKTIVPASETAAAAVIVATVKRNRGISAFLTQLLATLMRGETVERLLADSDSADTIPFSGEPRRSGLLDLSSIPAPPDEYVSQPAFENMPRPEVDALGKFETQQNAQPHKPVCSGPVVVHADGVSECYGCTQPLERFHPGGTSLSCSPGTRFGIGHSCERCRDE